jgi:DNA-binding NtrC family response regulator
MPASGLLNRVGSKKSAHEKPTNFLLLIVGGDYAGLESILRRKGYTVVVPSTSDQAVAVCLHNQIAAVLMDRKSLIEGDDWSLAQSLKMVSPNTPIVLMIEADRMKTFEAPSGVDCVVSDEDGAKVFQALKQCMRESAERIQSRAKSATEG